jgi:hypothetical protein
MTKFFPPVSPKHFSEAMERHWTSLDNHTSPELKKSWFEQGNAYGHQIFNHDNDEAPDERTKWVVLNPPTGAGKTEGTMLYCVMMANVPADQHPGVLLVTRMIKDADKIAKRINELSKKEGYAISYHSDNSMSVSRENLAKHSVLVITHKAYEAALFRFKDEHAFNQTWPSFCSWQSSGRRLVVIDEAPNLTHHSQIGLEGLRQTLAAISQETRDRHAYEVKVISTVIEIMEHQANHQDGKECIIPKYLAEDGRVDFTALRKSMQTIRFDEQTGPENDTENKRLSKVHNDRLVDLQQILTDDMYYAKVRGKPTLNSSTLIVPHGVKGAIVLDATASASPMYQLFDRATVIPMPSGIRFYGNVTLYINRGQQVGKDFLKKNTNTLLVPVINDLNERLVGSNVFFATHTGIKAKVAAAYTNFKKCIGTWGAIDGSNEWKDCDTAVIFGLPSKPDTWTANIYNGFRGTQSTEWLQSKDRPFGDHADVRSTLKTGDTVTQIVQAINRICCRKVIDSKGNCPEANIFLLLPDGNTGDLILQGIIELMDGIVVKPWVIQGLEAKETKRGRPSGKGTAAQPLLDFLFTMPTGKVSKAEVMEQTKVTLATFKRFVVETKKEASSKWEFLNDLGITYVTGKGKNAETYFNKVEQVQ